MSQIEGFPCRTERTLSEHLDRVIEGALARERIVGVVVRLALDGKVVYLRAAGMADRESGLPMREDMVFRLASITKLFVSVAALASAEQELIGLEDPVTKWLPSFRPRLPDGREPAITLRHLLTHTSGLGYGHLPNNSAYREAGVSNGLDRPGLSLQEQLRRLASVPLLCEPGTAWNYSLSTDVLGATLAVAHGMTLPEVVQQLVIEPLGLQDAGFNIKDHARLAVPYVNAFPRPLRMMDPQVIRAKDRILQLSPSRILDPRSYPSGGGGMAGTGADVHSLLEALRLGGAPILRRASVQALCTNALPESVAFEDPGWGFGLGVAVLLDPENARTPHSLGTWQWGGVYGHHYFVDPGQRISAVILTNVALEGPDCAFTMDVRDAIYHALST
jgi:CubicO group peptidase (beta-lactamase class C family)